MTRLTWETENKRMSREDRRELVTYAGVALYKKDFIGAEQSDFDTSYWFINSRELVKKLWDGCLMVRPEHSYDRSKKLTQIRLDIPGRQFSWNRTFVHNIYRRGEVAYHELKEITE